MVSSTSVKSVKCVLELYCMWKLSQTFGKDNEKWHIKMTEEIEGKYESALRKEP